jgi:hypothetical protein
MVDVDSRCGTFAYIHSRVKHWSSPRLRAAAALSAPTTLTARELVFLFRRTSCIPRGAQRDVATSDLPKSTFGRFPGAEAKRRSSFKTRPMNATQV